LEVTEFYRRRWQNKLFFKWIKPNLKIKAFYGISKNAGLIQIRSTLIAYLLLVWLKFKSKAGWGLLEPWPCGRCLVCGHQKTDNLCYSISGPDSSGTKYQK